MDFQSYVRVYWRLLLSVGTISRFTTRIRWEDLQESPLHLLFKKTMVSRQESLTFPVKQPMDFGATGLAKDATTDEV